MDKARLYAALPTALQHLATAAYGIQMRRARSGPAYREQRRALAASERLDREQIAELQSVKLQQLIAHAVASTRYYAELFARLGLARDDIRRPQDLTKLPLLEKSTLFERTSDLRAAGLGGVRFYHTSGTSGTTLAIPIDDASRQRNYAFFARARAWAGVEHGSSATFAGRTVVPASQTRPKQVWRWNPAMRNRLFSSYHLSPDNAPAYSRALCEWGPDYIDSYPSAISSLAGLLRDQGLPAPRPQAIITSSETLLEAQRDLVQEVFGAPIFDQYGSTEQAAYVSQCEFGSYHVHPEYGVVEIVDSTGQPAKPGEAGEIVCTSFTNDALPLIRYRTGDIAVICDAACSCGRRFPVLQEIVGRLDDLLITPDGRRIGRLDPIFKGRRTIREAQVIQQNGTQVIVNVVPTSDYTETDAREIETELRNRVGAAMQIVIETVPAIDRGPSGKFRAVINRVRIDGRSGEAR